MSEQTTTPAEYDWDSLVPSEAAPVSVKKTTSPFDAMTLPAAIRDRIESSLHDYVRDFAAYVKKGNKPENFRYDWKVQPFPTLEMANKFVTFAKKYAQFRPDFAVIYPDGLTEGMDLGEGVELPSGQITVRLGKPGPYTPPGADKVLHEIAVRYVAKPLEKSDTVNLPGSAAGQNGTPLAETPSADTPPAENPPAENPPAENPPAENPAHTEAEKEFIEAGKTKK